MPPPKKQHWIGYALPAMASLLLHGLALMAVLSWQGKPPPREIKLPNYVQAKLVKLQPQTEQKAKPAEDKPQIVDLTKKREEQERLKRLAEQKRQQALKEKQEAERKKKEEAERKRQEAERREAERKAQQKREAERKAQEAQERKRQEQQRAQQEQAAFEQALAEEQSLLQEEAYAVAAQSYMAAIAQRIEQNWSRPPSARNDMQCELLIKLVPTGRVISVDVIESSGNAVFDRSAIQAVRKVEQFPEIKEMSSAVFERYYRELTLVFKPQDLRQ